MKTITLNGVNYRVVKKSTKLGQSILDKYENYEGVTLWEVYGHHSERKESALRWCKNRMAELQGFGFVITSHNTHQFTCAFEFYHNGKICLAYFTVSNNYFIEMED